MDSETVRIELGLKSYTVDATFYFFNHGDSTQVAVGFPEVGHASGVIDAVYELLKEQRLRSFETWVDGVKTEVRDLPGEVRLGGKKTDYDSAEELVKKKLEPEGADYASVEERRWLVKEVAFKSGRYTVVRVRYASQTGVDGNGSHAGYIYGTGRSWKGPIGSMRFIIQASSQAWVHELEFPEERKYKVARLSEYECSYLLEGIKPKEDEALALRFGDSFQPWDIRKAYNDWEYVDHPVPDELLHALSRRQLKLLRNTFFAGHGRIFKDPELQSFFDASSVSRYGWYTARADFKDADLNENERRNVQKIMRYEKDLTESLGR